MTAQPKEKPDHVKDFLDYLDEVSAPGKGSVVAFPSLLAKRGPVRRQQVLNQSLERMWEFEKGSQ